MSNEEEQNQFEFLKKITPAHIANCFLFWAWQEGKEITPMKLIKLVYIAYGWYLAFYNKRLFRERFEAWDYGPVCPPIYHEFKRFGRNSIPKDNYSWYYYEDKNTGELSPEKPEWLDSTKPEQQDVANVLGAVWRFYKDKSGVELSKITHEKGSPWSIAREKQDLYLDDNLIKERSGAAIRKYIPESVRS